MLVSLNSLYFIMYVNNYIFNNFTKNFLNLSHSVNKYYIINDLLWQEGFLIDFLQKKIADNWIKKFLIISSAMFNDRLVFDKIIRFYLILFIWPAHKLFIFDINNIASLLNTFLIIFFLLISVLFFFNFLMF